jgi:hypothetical protein
MKAGFRFFAGNRVLVALTIGVIIAALGTGALNSLNVFFVPHNLHVTAKWLGTRSPWRRSRKSRPPSLAPAHRRPDLARQLSISTA